MSEKRALIVDDSKSARVVLSRMLEKYDLAVDTSDSAEHALEYLKAHRPDVIFMDHLMPGMDGLAAVQAIRSNPETSAIPIMMYTSQEGELYLGQARALGANGVLPKRIGSTEVSRILQDLRLLDAPPAGGAGAATGDAGVHSGPIIVAAASAPGADASSVPASAAAGSAVTGEGPGPHPGTAPVAAAPPSELPAGAAAAVPSGPAASPAATAAAAAPAVAAATSVAAAPAPTVHVVPLADLQRVLEPLLKQHSADLRRFVVASLDGFAARVVADARDAAPALAAAPATPVAALAPAPLPIAAPAPDVPRPIGWIAFALAASVAAVAAGAFAWYQQRQIDALTAGLAPARPALVASPEAARATAAAAGERTDAVEPVGAAPAAAVPAAVPAEAAAAPALPALAPATFPYGAPPLADARLEQLVAALSELERGGARGVLTATLHSGEFCLTGNPAEGYALAPDEMPADRCDLVGNPHYDGLRPAQRQGAGYADLVAALRARTAGALDVRVVDAGRQGVVAAYPAAGGASAQEWNAAAAANQRIEFAYVPAGGAAGASR